jgi:serine protease Do
MSSPTAPPFCPGEYAEDLAALSPRVREFEKKPQDSYTYCVRSTAVYECLSYGADGAVRRARKKATAHGTGFGYRQHGGETLLLTNQHVADWPQVTDEDHRVEGIPSGCKRVSDALRIVDSEGDAFERDDTALSRVVTDPQLDVAVLKAPKLLPILPWKVGHSAALRARTAVDVRGFPLGAFQASSVGKVISTRDIDREREWEHEDFVVDALLSPGNSGSPVLAVSCQTGEFELVGIYHAGYTGGSALNAVVGIDQVKELMSTLKRARPRTEAATLDAADRSRLIGGVRGELEPFFPFGSLPAVARARPDGALVFEVLPRDFPVKAHSILVLEDLPAGDRRSFGEMGRLWVGNRQGLREVDTDELDADATFHLARALEALRRDALLALDYREAARAPQSSRERFEVASEKERAVRRAAAAHRDLSNQLVELAERLLPLQEDTVVPLADAYAVPPLPPAQVPVSPPTARVRNPTPTAP